ncbi:hypothetical protein RvY_06336 [Ramazzottius varieornatus]|uniref:Uncharacterized protein n=1 Tax=Ramazzottius varieornatus TaxID=947166 RepID=A0A1D1UY66_RAMVA|nr:hypothetical protein RvY_06336 [Ramazzottius varieornatus]
MDQTIFCDLSREVKSRDDTDQAHYPEVTDLNYCTNIRSLVASLIEEIRELTWAEKHRQAGRRTPSQNFGDIVGYQGNGEGSVGASDFTGTVKCITRDVGKGSWVQFLHLHKGHFEDRSGGTVAYGKVKV